MAKGNGILLAAHPRGIFLEGICGEIFSPGNLLQLDAAVEPVNGRYTFEEWDGTADGEQAIVIVAMPDKLQGRTADTAYAAGDRCFAYVPCPGEELNVMVQASAGALAIGAKLIRDDATGTLILTTGTPEQEPFIILETASDPASDSLIHCMATGC